MGGFGGDGFDRGRRLEFGASPAALGTVELRTGIVPQPRQQTPDAPAGYARDGPGYGGTRRWARKLRRQIGVIESKHQGISAAVKKTKVFAPNRPQFRLLRN